MSAVSWNPYAVHDEAVAASGVSCRLRRDGFVSHLRYDRVSHDLLILVCGFP